MANPLKHSLDILVIRLTVTDNKTTHSELDLSATGRVT